MVFPELVEYWDVQHARICPSKSMIKFGFISERGSGEFKAKLNLVTSIEELLLSLELSQLL